MNECTPRNIPVTAYPEAVFLIILKKSLTESRKLNYFVLNYILPSGLET